MKYFKTGFAAIVFLSLIFALSGCGMPDSGDSSSDSAALENGALDTFSVKVDIDSASIDISPTLSTSSPVPIGNLYGSGYPIAIYTLGCTWMPDPTNALICDIAIDDIGGSGMNDVHTRLHSSTNPAAMIADADFIFDGHIPTINLPNTTLPINGSGYCHAGMGGIAVGCETDDAGIGSFGGNVTQWVFTNVAVGQYQFFVTIYGMPGSGD